jgi:tetratricopeptide (TPR) repeat protein
MLRLAIAMCAMVSPIVVSAQSMPTVVAPGGGFFHCDDARTLGIRRPANCPASKVYAPPRSDDRNFQRSRNVGVGLAAGAAALQIFGSIAEYLAQANEANPYMDELNSRLRDSEARRQGLNNYAAYLHASAQRLVDQGQDERALPLLKRALDAAREAGSEVTNRRREAYSLVRAKIAYKQGLAAMDAGQLRKAADTLRQAAYFSSDAGKPDLRARIEAHQRELLDKAGSADQSTRKKVQETFRHCYEINGQRMCQ